MGGTSPGGAMQCGRVARAGAVRERAVSVLRAGAIQSERRHGWGWRGRDPFYERVTQAGSVPQVGNAGGVRPSRRFIRSITGLLDAHLPKKIITPFIHKEM